MKNPIDKKLYMNQMKRDLQLQRLNKEKDMKQEIMILKNEKAELKNENAELKNQIRQFADWFQLLAKKLKEVNKELDRYKKTQSFKPVIIK